MREVKQYKVTYGTGLLLLRGTNYVCAVVGKVLFLGTQPNLLQLLFTVLSKDECVIRYIIIRGVKQSVNHT